MNPWNTTNRIDIDVYHREQIVSFYNQVISVSKPKRKAMLSKINLDPKSKEYLNSLYQSGYGIKILARELGLSYSRFRTLFVDYLGLTLREGRNVVTTKLREFRSERISKERNPWFDWCANKPTMQKGCSRGIQGYYTKRSGQKVWLRSTFEYIYAKWLDRNLINWKIEEKQYTLSNGETYRPDFFIYENDVLQKIVEIKGYFKNRRYKAEMFQTEFNTPLVIIDDIMEYCENYEQEKKEWKQIKL